MIYSKTVPSPVGDLTLASDGKSILGLWMEGQKHFAAGYPELVQEELPVFAQAEHWLARYFRGDAPSPWSLPLSPKGSDFQKRVWALLLEIPYGETTTYGALAKKLSCKSAQAVGNAVGRNPISIIIPCHRVLGANGSLTGYAGGIQNKTFLLELEKRSSSL